MSSDPTTGQPVDSPAWASTPASRSPARRWAWRLVRYAIFAIVLFFVGRELVRRFQEAQWSHVAFRPWFLVLATVLQVLASLTGPMIFRWLLQPLCQPPTWRALFATVWIARIGKYIPGKFASTAGAIWMLHRQGVPAAKATTATLLAQGLMVLSSLLTALPLACWPPIHRTMPMAWWLCAALLAAGAICMHPRVFSGAASLALRLLGVKAAPMTLRVADFGKPLAAIFVGQVLGGLMLWALMSSVADVPASWIPLCISAGAMAGAASLLAVFAPGGLGVREGVLLVILGQVLSAGESAIVVVVARLVQVLVEVVLAFSGLLLARQASKGSPHD